MYKVCICGHFGGNKNFADGQTIKTKTIYNELCKIYGNNDVITVDTYQWKKKPFSLLINCFKNFKNSKNLIILPAYKGIKVFAPFFAILSKFYKRKIFYVVIGGWLPDILKKQKNLIKFLKCYNGIFVETCKMQQKLIELNLKNVKILVNSKDLEILNKKNIKRNYNVPYKLCTFSRVLKEKGIEDAIKVVKSFNKKMKKVCFELDIYGQIDNDYRSEFEKIIKNCPDYIKYKGVIHYTNTVQVLKDYYCLLFPTYYKGEGIAGTLIDALASGVPIIASDWKYNSEIVKDSYNGFMYKTHNNNELFKLLEKIYNNKEIIINMRENCIETANKYLSKNVIKELILDFD